MKKFRVFLFTALLVFFAGVSVALPGNDIKVNQKGTVITITFDGATDFEWQAATETQNLGRSIKIIQIKYIASTTGDRFIIYDRLADGTTEGPAFFDTGPIADIYDVRVDAMGGGVTVTNPWIDISDCTMGAQMAGAADCKLIIIIERPQ